MSSHTYAKALPRRGRDTEQILDELEALRLGDVQWQRGKALSLVSPADDEVENLCSKAFLSYFREDGLNPAAFPSLRQMEAEVVSMTAQLLGGGSDAVGNMTSSSSESSFLTVRAAREWARIHRPKVTHPEAIIPQSAHPDLLKSCHDLGVKAVLVPIDSVDFKVDLKAVTKALTDRTILLVGSAPTIPHGVVDPIPELGQIASNHGVLCHVDASMGGFFLPFLSAIDEPSPPFDLSIEGVTSIAADLHTYGAGAPSSSVLLYENAKLRRHQYFVSVDWPGGVFASPIYSRTRSGGAVAAAWAVMHKLGFEGYREMVRDVMAMTRNLQQRITAIEGLEVLGRPKMSVMAIGSRKHNVFELADHLAGRGWHLERQINPPSLNITVSAIHEEIVDILIDDLRQAADATTQEPVERLLDRTRGLLISTATRVIPKNIFNRVTSFAGTMLGLSTQELTISSIPVRGIHPAMPHGGDIKEATYNTLDDLTHLEEREKQEPDSNV